MHTFIHINVHAYTQTCIQMYIHTDMQDINMDDVKSPQNTQTQTQTQTQNHQHENYNVNQAGDSDFVSNKRADLEEDHCVNDDVDDGHVQGIYTHESTTEACIQERGKHEGNHAQTQTQTRRGMQSGYTDMLADDGYIYSDRVVQRRAADRRGLGGSTEYDNHGRRIDTNTKPGYVYGKFRPGKSRKDTYVDENGDTWGVKKARRKPPRFQMGKRVGRKKR
jgi:hypothetical protein